MQTQLIFWILGAIDGHARNFSLFMRPGGFSLTPLYDVMSAEPHINPKTLPSKKIRMAMSVGNASHYKIGEILPRHWHQTAFKCKFDGIEKLVEQVVQDTPKAIEAVSEELPNNFPTVVSERIFEAMSNRAKNLAGRL